MSSALIELKCVESKRKHVTVGDQSSLKESSRIRKNQVEVAFQAPKFESLIEMACPKMMFDFRSNNFDLVASLVHLNLY